MGLWHRKKAKIAAIEQAQFSIVGLGLTIPRALVVTVHPNLMFVKVNQPANRVAIVTIVTPKAAQYKSGDIVKIYGMVEQQYPTIVIKAQSIMMTGRIEDYTGRVK